ncbi:unnamed protein product, partial [Mesorhabditis spiculigera]
MVSQDDTVQIPSALHIKMIENLDVEEVYRYFSHYRQYLPEQSQDENDFSEAAFRELRQFFRTRHAAFLKRKEKELGDALAQTKLHYDKLILLDVECTCDKTNIMFTYPLEVIEFSAVVLDLYNLDDPNPLQFQAYVRPTLNPILSEFCVKLTKIEQATVDAAPPFSTAMCRFMEWMKLNDLLTNRSAFGTDGPGDFAKFLQYACHSHQIDFPYILRRFINVKSHFEAKYPTYIQKGIRFKETDMPYTSLMQMLKFYELPDIANAHSALADAKAIRLLAREMLRDKIALTINQKIVQKTSEDQLQYQTKLDRAQESFSAEHFLWCTAMPFHAVYLSDEAFYNQEQYEFEGQEDEAVDRWAARNKKDIRLPSISCFPDSDFKVLRTFHADDVLGGDFSAMLHAET